jgi:predicted nucleic acid-binding protein
MSRIFWDTNLFVYLFEENPEFSRAVADLKRRMVERGDDLVTSAMTLGEVQVKPRERKNIAAA